ncbi:MAG: hypothetical protein MUP22_11165, partial [Desulfobacterales bacterium]|nr:hypothetical protein [Desulfobacterales bacterium]
AANIKKEPLLLLFKWREYRLTPFSLYPIVPLPDITAKNIDYNKMIQNELFDIKEFTGFIVIKLKKNTGNFVEDMYTIIQHLVGYAPNDSSAVEIYLAAGRLAIILGKNESLDYLNKAEKLAGERNSSKIQDIINGIKN